MGLRNVGWGHRAEVAACDTKSLGGPGGALKARRGASPGWRTLSPRNIGTLVSVTDRRSVPARFGRSRVEVHGCRVLAEARHAPSLRLCCGNSWPC